jgi:hypothetical protein
MRASYTVALLATLVGLSGCYTTVVDTGREPAHRTVRDGWVMGYASGLIMVEEPSIARRCPFGVARVVTEQSVPNLLVQVATAGLLSPRSVEVTCAAGPEAAGFEWQPRTDDWRAEGRHHGHSRHRHHGH